jgi:hypothetical protein
MIVKHTNNIMPVIDGLIMIDCWNPNNQQRSEYNNFYMPLLSQLIKFDLKCIVNAAYNVDLSTQDISIRNTLKTYYWPESKIQNANIVQNLVKNCGASNKTSVLFEEVLMHKIPSVMLLEFDDFVHHWQMVLDCQVNHWLVVGQAWKSCVHNRQMGLDNMYRNTQHHDLNFYALTDGFKTDDGTVTTHKNFQQDNLPWELVKDFGYKLVTRSSGHWTQSMDFYQEFINESRISVQIHCTADVAPLIPASDETFDVTVVYEPKESWQFSYSKFVGAYQLDQSNLNYHFELPFLTIYFQGQNLLNILEYPFSIRIYEQPLLTEDQNAIGPESKLCLLEQFSKSHRYKLRYAGLDYKF